MDQQPNLHQERGGDRERGADGVEPVSYLRARPWVALALVLLPIVAAAVVFTIVLQRAPTYVAIVQEQIPGDAGASRLVIYEADFRLNLTSDEVQEEIVEQTGATRAELVDHLTVDRLGQSSVLQVRYESDQRAEAVRVVATALATTKIFQAAQGAEGQTRALADLQVRSREANLALQDVQARNNLLFPDDEYRSLTSALRDANRDLNRATLGGDPLAAQIARRDIGFFAEQQAGLAPVVREYELARAQADAADEALASAEQAQAVVQEAVSTVAPAPEPDSYPLSQITPAVQSAVGAAALVLLLSGLVLLGPDLLRGRRRDRAGTAARADGPAANELADDSAAPVAGPDSDAPVGKEFSSVRLRPEQDDSDLDFARDEATTADRGRR